MAGTLAGAGIVWQTPANPPEAQDYIFHNGRRYVRPYYFEFISHVKNRWAEKTIVDLFTEEFKGRPREYYAHAVKCGRLQVDEQMVHADYIVKSSQKISHFLHRHEPPVLGGNIVILQNEVDVVTVCKPASVPVHPCGQYRKNTVVGIMQAEHGLAPLFRILSSSYASLDNGFHYTTSNCCSGNALPSNYLSRSLSHHLTHFVRIAIQ